MKQKLLLLAILILVLKAYSQTKTIHVFVALCDNEFQGIVPVPAALGNGKDPESNLYWGAGYGVKSFLKLKTTDWKLIKTEKTEAPSILERLVFQHVTKGVYLLADAYDGEQIKECTESFLKASNAQNELQITFNGEQLCFGGAADLVAYIGHDGLMEFEVTVDYHPVTSTRRDVIILACYSREYFAPEIAKAHANPILWTTHLMAPEAYTLKAALDGWIKNETKTQIKERAAQSYNHYQKCGLGGARNLFVSDFAK